jgi:hypothetical protein
MLCPSGVSSSGNCTLWLSLRTDHFLQIAGAVQFLLLQLSVSTNILLFLLRAWGRDGTEEGTERPSHKVLREVACDV